MGDSQSELLLVLKAKDLASSKVDGLGDSLDKTGKKSKSAGGLLGGFGKTAGLVALTGVGALVAGLAMATASAAEEEKGIAALDAALKANDKAYKGNTDSIEALITKRTALAFADDELRSSLTFLVTKYKDVDKAQALQSTAMDLARLKGISLDEATKMLTKGLDGSSKVLKQLGIDLPATATEQERLTAIQKAAAGQADAYGKTAAGAQEAFRLALGDLVEDAGALFLPIMKDVFGFLRETVIPAIRTVAKRVGEWMTKNKPLIDQIKKFVGGVLKSLWEGIGRVIDWIGKFVSAVANNKDAMNVLRTVFDLIGTAVGLVVKAIETLLGWLGDFIGWITSNKTIMKGVATAFDTIKGAVKGVVGMIKSLVGWAKDAIKWLGDIIDLIPDIQMPWDSNSAPMAGDFQMQAGPVGGAFSPTSSSMAPVVIPVVIDGREVARVVDRRLMADLRRAAPTASGA